MEAAVLRDWGLGHRVAQHWWLTTRQKDVAETERGELAADGQNDWKQHKAGGGMPDIVRSTVGQSEEGTMAWAYPQRG